MPYFLSVWLRVTIFCLSGCVWSVQTLPAVHTHFVLLMHSIFRPVEILYAALILLCYSSTEACFVLSDHWHLINIQIPQRVCASTNTPLFDVKFKWGTKWGNMKLTSIWILTHTLESHRAWSGRAFLSFCLFTLQSRINHSSTYGWTPNTQIVIHFLNRLDKLLHLPSNMQHTCICNSLFPKTFSVYLWVF